MNDPPRLRDQSKNPLIGEMLSAAGRQAPRRRAVSRTLLAVTTAAGVVGGQASAGAAVGGATAASLAKLAVKWTLLSAVVAGGGIAGLESSGLMHYRVEPSVNVERSAGERSAGERSAVERSAVERGDSVDPELSTLVVEGSAEWQAAAAALPDTVPPRPRVEVEPPVRLPVAQRQQPRRIQGRQQQLEHEVALLDEARRALSDEHYAEARRISEQYLTRYPQGSLEQEARYLKMHAAHHEGDRARAQAEARTLLVLNPNGPHAKAAREVVAGKD